MVVNVPRIVESVANDPREMVRVQFGPNDTRSYTRLEAEKLISGGSVPGAIIVGDQAVKAAVAEGSERLSGQGSTFEEAADDLKSKAGAKVQRSSPNKARRPAEPKTDRGASNKPPSSKPAESAADGTGDGGKPVETKSE